MSVISLNHPEASEHSVAGGKGANLGRMSAAGFPVPPAFIVSTDAYRRFLADSSCREAIDPIIAAVDVTDLDSLRADAARIQQIISEHSMPADLAEEITRHYGQLGEDALYVAVRSSGTAEDLAGASFAGLHDTYLDVREATGVVEAVQRCWSSLWTDRAIAYRHNNGFDHFEALIAVVVQQMVPSTVAGVMFTGNPRTAATDETVINATWGLGESLVQGIITPDEYVVRSSDDRVLERTLGSKELRIVRADGGQGGTVTEEVPNAERAAWTLTDPQVRDLVELGRRITEHYDGYPQDIEWALVDSELYLLQSRPITGIEFAWDADVDDWQPGLEDPETVWTWLMADEAWTGAITPLMYSWRAHSWDITNWHGLDLIGRQDLKPLRCFTYHRGYAYWNCQLEKGIIESAPALARPGMVAKLPASWRPEALAAPLSVTDYLKQLVRIKLLRPDQGVYSWVGGMRDHLDNRVPEAEGLPDTEVRALSDRNLKDYIRRQIEFEWQYGNDVATWPAFFMYFRDAMAALYAIVDRWYDGPTEIIGQLLAGTPTPTAAVRENFELYDIAQAIKESPAVHDAFLTRPGTQFFDQLDSFEGAEKTASKISEFLELHGHRGHSDRDMSFPRWRDDLSLLYVALEAHLKSDSDPRQREEETNHTRNAAAARVIERLTLRPFGFLRAEIFKTLHSYCLMFTEARDNEREYLDRSTYTIRRGFLEVNRRLLERGLVETDRDFWFLTQTELWDLVEGRANRALLKYKIAGRMVNWDKLHRKEVALPKFIQRKRPVDLEEHTSETDDQGRQVLRGLPTSAGTVVGVARVIKELREISRVSPGEILIANSTDPGWTPVFALIKGVIVETGGLLSHSGCLAREYGFPAAQIENALQTIPDGATIELNGDAGTVRILDENNAEAGEVPDESVHSAAD